MSEEKVVDIDGVKYITVRLGTNAEKDGWYNGDWRGCLRGFLDRLDLKYYELCVDKKVAQEILDVADDAEKACDALYEILTYENGKQVTDAKITNLAERGLLER